MTAKLFFCFPGQGVQYPGMLENIAHREKWLSQASEALNKDLFGIDSAQALEHTHAVQLCLLISATAQGETLKAAGIRPNFVAGLSIGAFAAAVCCGSLEFDDAVRLVALRGELMEHAYPSGYGMTVIIGLHFDKVERLCLATSGVYIANYNAETQIVIAGSEEGMADVCQQALEKGANRVQRINISVPSHCKLLQDANVARVWPSNCRRATYSQNSTRPNSVRKMSSLALKQTSKSSKTGWNVEVFRHNKISSSRVHTPFCD